MLEMCFELNRRDLFILPTIFLKTFFLGEMRKKQGKMYRKAKRNVFF